MNIFGANKSQRTPNCQLFRFFKGAYHWLDFHKIWERILEWQFYYWDKTYEHAMCRHGFFFVLVQNRAPQSIKILFKRLNKMWKYLLGKIHSWQWSLIILRPLLLKSLKTFFDFLILKIFIFWNMMHKCLKHKSIHFIHIFLSGQSSLSQKYQSENIDKAQNKATNCP